MVCFKCGKPDHQIANCPLLKGQANVAEQEDLLDGAFMMEEDRWEDPSFSQLTGLPSNMSELERAEELGEPHDGINHRPTRWDRKGSEENFGVDAPARPHIGTVLR